MPRNWRIAAAADNATMLHNYCADRNFSSLRGLQGHIQRRTHKSLIRITASDMRHGRKLVV